MNVQKQVKDDATGRLYHVVKSDNFDLTKPTTVIHYMRGDWDTKTPIEKQNLELQGLTKHVVNGKCIIINGKAVSNFVLVSPYGDNSAKWGWNVAVQRDKDWIEKNFNIGTFVLAGYSAGGGAVLNFIGQNQLTGKKYNVVISFNGYYSPWNNTINNFDYPALVNYGAKVFTIGGDKDTNTTTGPSMIAVDKYFKANPNANIKTSIVNGDHGTVVDNPDNWNKIFTDIIKPEEVVTPEPTAVEYPKFAHEQITKIEGDNIGCNMAWIPGNAYWDDDNIVSALAVLGFNSIRQTITKQQFEQWGYDFRVGQYKHHAEKGMINNVLYLNNKFTDFKGVYEPILLGDGSINEQNELAVYIKKVITNYGGLIKTLAFCNEPDWTSDWRTPGDVWTTRKPTVQELPNINGTIDDYVRMLRVVYVVTKKISPMTCVGLGGISYPSFLKHVMETFNDGLRGGAFFDVLIYHCYSHYDQKVIANLTAENAVKSIVDKHVALTSMLELDFNYNDTKFPKKNYVLGEFGFLNSPQEGTAYAGNQQYQHDAYLLLVKTAASLGLKVTYYYSFNDFESKDEYGKMGLVTNVTKVNDVKDMKLNGAGIALAEYRKSTQPEVMIPRTEVLERITWLKTKLDELAQLPIKELNAKLETLRSAAADWEAGLNNR